MGFGPPLTPTPALTQEVFIPAEAATGTGAVSNKNNYPSVRLNAATQACFFRGFIKKLATTVTFQQALLVYIPTTTGTWSFTLNTNFAQGGAASTTNTDALSVAGQAATGNQMTHLDVSGAFDIANWAPGMTFGAKLTLDALTTTEIHVLGIQLIFLPNS